jgi:hypothetical protein
MQLAISKGKVIVEMHFYIEKILVDYGKLKEYLVTEDKEMLMVEGKAPRR